MLDIATALAGPAHSQGAAAEAILLPRSVDPACSSSVLQRLAFWCVFGLVALAALLAGLEVRWIAFHASERVRYEADIDNAFLQGTAALQQGFFDTYDDEYARGRGGGIYDLDYAPARLAIATLWTRWVRLQVDGRPADWRLIADWPTHFYARARALHRTYALCRPLLWFNDLMEVAAAAGVFALVRRWTLGRGNPRRAAMLGLMAAIVFWFNPALIWDAHCWPQWDCWLLPFLLWALVAASDGWWFTAGALLGAAVLFKSQILLGAPLLILWPLLRGRFLMVGRLLAGFVAAVAVCTSPWLVRANHATSLAAIGWIVGIGVAIVLLCRWPRLRTNRPLVAGMIAAAVLLICWPLWRLGWIGVACGLAATAGLGALLCGGSRRVACQTAVVSLSAALLLSVVVFGGSIAWLRVGVLTGAQASQTMIAGPNTNLPALLESQYGWKVMDPVFTIPRGRMADVIASTAAALDRHFHYQAGAPVGFPLKYVLGLAYLSVLVICAAAAGLYASRGSTRFLLAVATPWVLMYAILPHMHERYLMWGAAIGAITVALSPGWALLNLFLSFVAFGLMLSPSGGPAFHQMVLVKWVDGWTPGVGWAILLAGAIMLYGTLAPPRRAAPTA